jgi:hypothetical protein
MPRTTFSVKVVLIMNTYLTDDLARAVRDPNLHVSTICPRHSP